jgi:hypothetical protein
MDLILNQAEIEALFRQNPNSENDGGWQQLLVTLQQRTDRRSGAIRLTPDLLERIQRYAFDYGNGGWENRLRGVFERNLGPRLGRG